MWDVAADLGTTIVPCLFTRHLPALAEVIEGRPEVPVALDHCAFPDMGEEGEAAVLRLADLPEVHLKVTSYVLEMAQRDEGDPAGIVERLASAFGANRLCWGSDHPQDQRSTYAGKVELAHHATRTLDAGRPRRGARRHGHAPLVQRLTYPRGGRGYSAGTDRHRAVDLEGAVGVGLDGDRAVGRGHRGPGPLEVAEARARPAPRRSRARPA